MIAARLTDVRYKLRSELRIFMAFPLQPACGSQHTTAIPELAQHVFQAAGRRRLSRSGNRLSRS
jgi:hypothetical protein